MDSIYAYYVVSEILTDEEQQLLLKQCKAGNKEAREKLIYNNIRLVMFIVKNDFESAPYDKKDLVSIGIIGLEKAIDTYDFNKSTSFSTYFGKCIHNEIGMFLRKIRKNIVVDSLDRVICNDVSPIRLMDIISDNTDLTRKLEKNEINTIIRGLVNKLPAKERKVIEMFFGFNGTTYNQYEIANEISMSQCQISRIIRKVLSEFKVKLEEYEIIEKNREIAHLNNRKGRSDTKKTIYEFFSNYSKEQVDKVIENLQENEKELIKLRFKNWNNTCISYSVDAHLMKSFYRLIGRMKKKLENESTVNNKGNEVIKRKNLYIK